MARFNAILAAYNEAEDVTRNRLYIEAIEEVYSRSNKVILDSQGSGNLLYLPIDKLIQNQDERNVMLDPPRTVEAPRNDEPRMEASRNDRDRRTRQ